jgi:uncharacterized phosphosugar-binding protein
MQLANQYLSHLQSMLDKAIKDQLQPIHKAALAFAETIDNEGYIYVFGTGHSHLMAEELFYRAGGLTRIYPILEESLMLHNGAIKSTEIERLSEYAAVIAEQYKFSDKDTIVICSNSGRNNIIVEMAYLAKEKGMKVIALTNLNHAKSVTSRHNSGLKLYQIAEIVLDNQGVIGDACISTPLLKGNTGATSTVIGAAILHAIEITTIEMLLNKGLSPEIFQSSNIDGGDEINKKYFDLYRDKIKPL